MLNICTPQKLDVKYKRKRNSGVSWLKWQRVLPGGKSDDWNKGDEEVLVGVVLRREMQRFFAI